MNKLNDNVKCAYLHPMMEVVSVNQEGVLCISGGTDDFKYDDTWSDIFGGTQ